MSGQLDLPMTAAAFVRVALTAPSSSCRVDLEGLGDPHPRGTAIFLLIDAERTHDGDWRDSGAGYVEKGERFRVVHAISRWAGGEVRGWIWSGERLRVRHPVSPATWPELDALVAEALGASIATTQGAA